MTDLYAEDVFENFTNRELHELADEAHQPDTEPEPIHVPKAKKKSQAQIILELSADQELFHTDDGLCFSTFWTGKHFETWPIRSKSFKRWISRIFYTQEGKVPSSQPMSDALNVLEAKAQFDGGCSVVHTRVGEHEGRIYLDLANSSWQVVEITADGWSVKDDSPVKFRRSTGMLPLPQPLATGSINELRPLINAENEDNWIMDVAWLLGALKPSGPYPISVDVGEQGSAKSTRQKIKRMVIDPTKAPLRSSPKEIRDIMIAARHGWVISLDNISFLPVWLSDVLCRLATGGGFATRQLYSNDDEEIFESCRPIMINGIENVVQHSDLVGRALILNIPPIPEGDRRTENDVMGEFTRLHPRILGGLLNVISKTLKRYPDIHLERLPRMADFAKWVVAGEAGLGWKKGTFLACYTENRKQSIYTTLEADALASAIIALMDTRELWEGSATLLLDELERLVDDRTKNSKSWPGSPAWLTRRLNRPATFLRSIGIEIEQAHSTDRSILIRKSGENAVLTDRAVLSPINAELDPGSKDGKDSNSDSKVEMPSGLKRPPDAGSDSKDGKDSKIPIQSGKEKTESKGDL